MLNLTGIDGLLHMDTTPPSQTSHPAIPATSILLPHDPSKLEYTMNGLPGMSSAAKTDNARHGEPFGQQAISTNSVYQQSPTSVYSLPGAPRRTSGMGYGYDERGESSYTSEHGRDVEGNGPRRKRSSVDALVLNGSGSGSMMSPEEEEGDGDVDSGGTSTRGKRKKGSGSHGSGIAGLTSCEACRKGKRRCEPSPLVPATHPDVAKLPCARCRRFALDCVRVKVQKRKGPAPVDLSAYSDAAHGFAPATNGSSSSHDTGHQDLFGDVKARRQSSGVSEHSMPSNLGQSGVFTSNSFPILSQSPSTNHEDLPDNLDQVVAPHIIDNIIALFFDYVYPLTPFIHRPTFLANLAARRDKTDPIFFALTLTVIASTLVQVPRTLMNLDKAEVEALARRCIRAARGKIAYIWEVPGAVQTTYIMISYLEGIVHLLLGNNTAHVICTAQANQLALAMRLNEESSYEGLDAIESEMRRRMYWLLFQADKSTACLRARTICLRLEDANALQLPAEVDDESITADGILSQPPGKTSLMSGFNAVAHLFRILNDALLLQRQKTPPTVDSILADLSNVDLLREKVLQIMAELPAALQLRRAYDSRVSSPAQGWEAKLHERFLDYFQGVGDSNEELNSFLVMQGNILVTQHVVRLVILQTRENFLQQLALVTSVPLSDLSFTHAGQGGENLHTQSSEAAEDIACELLDGLNSLPVECVATNGPSLVQKVRFVAIQLLECSVNPSPQTAKAQRLLMQFLSVLSVIEGMYTFGRDISAE